MRVRRTPLPFIMILFVLSISPSFAQEDHREKDYEIVITKGDFAIENGDYSAAAAQYQQALAIKPGDKAATLSLGVAWSRAGDLTKAADTLRDALAIDPSDARARYELGVVLFKQNNLAAARAELAPVAETAADETVRAAAKSYLDRIAAREGTNRFSLGVQGGFQYDSNVILDPENPIAPPKERKSDGRGVVTLDGAYRIADRNAFSAVAGYQFYQSLHFHLEDFNVQQHTLNVAARSALSGNAALGLTYAFSYTNVGLKHYGTVHQLLPVLDLRFTPGSLTQLHLGYASKRFFDSSLFPGNNDRNAKNYSAGIGHTIQLTKGTTVAADYTYDRDTDAAVDVWNSVGNKGSLKLQSDLGPIAVYATASFTDRMYGASASLFIPDRHDQTQEYLAGLARGLSKTLRLTLTDDYTFNDSNQAAFRYTRNIVGLFMEIRL